MRRKSPIEPAGSGKPWSLQALELGAKALQSTPPLHAFDVYVVGFHPAKDDPSMQMEAHHFCRVVNDDLIEATIFDGNAADANLIGIEYIVSEALFETLDDDEQRLWHPHNYEILGGSLVAPGLPAAAEDALMRRLLNSYGKTWHTWHTGRHDVGGGHSLPLGEPMLMWSFNRDGETDGSLEADRERARGLDTARTRERRASMAEHARPQRGVDALRAHFPGASPVPGVVDDGRDARG